MRVAPVWALDEEILIFGPNRPPACRAETACAAMNMLFRLTIIMRSQASSVISRNGTKPVMPALLTRMVTGPSSACARCTPHRSAPGGHIDATGNGAAAARHDVARGALRARLVNIPDGHGGAIARQTLAGCETEAGRRARDDCIFAG